MRSHCRRKFLILSLLLPLLLCLSSADDAAVMTKLLAALSPTPSGWSGSAYCEWSGVVCDSSGRVSSITLSSQSLSGTIPSNLNSLSQITLLSLQNNRFSGTLPSLANLTLLREAYLDSNNFTSVPDGAFAGLSSLQTLSLSGNLNLSPWPFPSELTQSPSLVTFYASYANLVGSIPDIFGSFPNLQNLRLSYNNLTGSLPSSLGMSEIQNLWLNNQATGLSGRLDLLATMIQISQVWLHANAFTGPIPDLSNCTSLFDLQLRDNQLTGPVPTSVMSLSNLRNISLQNNKLQGPLPVFPKTVKVQLGTTNSFCLSTPGPCDSQVSTLLKVAGALQYPITLAESWEGNDACNQWPFITCDSSGRVIAVNFAKQHFTGTISPAFSNLTSLRSLYLNDNNLSGIIPESLTTLPQLQTLDISNNNLTGLVPKFGSSVKVVTKGNLYILTNGSTPSAGGNSGSGSNSTIQSGSTSGESKSSSVSIGMIVGLVIAAVVSVLVVLLLLYNCYVRRRHRKFGRVQNPESGKEMTNVKDGGLNGYAGAASEMQSQSSTDQSEIPVFDGGNVAISIQVLRQVTNNFSEDNILGKGGFGVVYRGELQDGTKIAVKRMEASATGTKGMSEFQAEIAVLTKVRHRHLVALLGYCINGNERLLVYEYMPQGTLGQHLFEWSEHGCPPLSWKQRVTIALDVARGVEYLHSLARSSFIHRDLKPSNILLGNDMRAKVADFGLVKNAPDGKYSLETRLAGTFGYLAPEYAATGRVTTKIDVYAFGVILMELITGRKALEETLPEERSHLVTWFRRILISKGNILNAIDAVLNPDEETYDSICRVAELAGHCTAREPHQRPDMGHAVNVLGPLVEQWKPSCQVEENCGIDLHTSLPQALLRWQADESTSRAFGDVSSSRTEASIPSKPSGFTDTFSSTDCR
ncbi:hypothetical protein Nepgr_009891 [Nepenthes gracilis]|uniref:non-specific serine/threonine protein kinase n=1 Tax=Nepenthes gracilis TaxID=150966 RepID=A0AAD3SBY0_NEPGR|nr:hypothetical protein Nepgr_009891 [Nepenthes gracilis]